MSKPLKLRARERVFRAAMRMHKLWPNNSYWEGGGKMFDAFVEMDKACAAATRRGK